MGKRIRAKDLGGFWKPDAQTKAAERKSRQRRNERRTKARKNLKKMKRKGLTSKRIAKLCLLPGEIFYATDAWRILRYRVLDHYGRRCMKCGAADTEMHVDHIKPRSKYPELSMDFDNLQVLCKHCNEEKSNFHCTDYREKATAENLDMKLVARATVIGL